MPMTRCAENILFSNLTSSMLKASTSQHSTSMQWKQKNEKVAGDKGREMEWKEERKRGGGGGGACIHAN